MANAFCAIPLPRLVYVGPQTREEFDRLELPEAVHEWKPDTATTLIKGDGKQWEHRCHSKTLGELGSSSVAVIFQWFEYRVAEISLPADSTDPQPYERDERAYVDAVTRGRL